LALDAGVPNGLGSAISIELKTGDVLGLAGDTKIYAMASVRVRDNSTNITIVPLASSDLSNLGTGAANVVSVGSPLIGSV
jgi:hypothetical protein